MKRVEFVRKYLDGIFAEDVHAKRVMSLANGAVGVMTGASLAVSIIGQSLAQARGLLSKHAIKQVSAGRHSRISAGRRADLNRKERADMPCIARSHNG